MRVCVCVFLGYGAAGEHKGEKGWWVDLVGGWSSSLRMEQSAENQATTCSTRGDDGRRSLLEVLRSGADPNNGDRDNYCNYRRNSERGKDTPSWCTKPRHFDANPYRSVRSEPSDVRSTGFSYVTIVRVISIELKGAALKDELPFRALAPCRATC